MKIEEIIRSCANERVAAAAVASIGRSFSHEIGAAADFHGMTLGGFAAFAVERFAKRGDERELRAVASVMASAQEPVLSGLHRILCITLASNIPSRTRREPIVPSRWPASLCVMDSTRRRELVG